MRTLSHKDLDRRNEQAAEGYRTTRDVFVYALKHEWTWEPADPKRREDCSYDLELALLTYWPEAFTCSFSSEHKKLIALIQGILIDGGCNVTAMPRGSGKTTIKTRALMWAALNGHRRFPVLGTSDDGQFTRLMRGIKVLLETNDLLRQDFPEVVIPIRQLERVATKCVYQLYRGEPTYIRWSDNFIQFPHTELTIDRGNAGVVMAGGGITGALRGMVYTMPDGQQIRPDAILCDDFQTRKSAKSASQVEEREQIIKGDLMGMRGDRPLAFLATCTPMYEDDAAERLLCNKRSPAFKPIRVPMMPSMPKNMDAWETYDVIRRQTLTGEVAPDEANKYYRDHRQQLEEGAVHYWPEKFDKGMVSAIQCAMHEYLDDPDMFNAEKQCQPLGHSKSDIQELRASDLAARTTTLPAGVVPSNHILLTAHVDVQAKVLYYAVCSWSEKFGGNVIEYNTWPLRTPGRHFTLRSLRTGLSQAYPGLDEGGQIRSGIRDCVKYLTEKQYQRETSGEIGLSLILCDGRWKTDDVEAGIIESKSPTAMMAFGIGIGAVHAPMSLYPTKPGRLRGDHWIEDKPQKRKRRALTVDVNHWKSELHGSLSVPDLHDEAIRFYKAGPTHHQMIADHCCAETAYRVESRNRTVDEWQLKMSTADNHHWDNLVGCIAAASRRGLKRSRDGSNDEKPQIIRRSRKAKAW